MTETDPAAVAAFIGNQRTGHKVPHRLACRILGVSESWSYKWRDKPTTARQVRRGQLADAIRQVFEDSGGTYGSPKVWLVLVREGWRVSVSTVARLRIATWITGFYNTHRLHSVWGYRSPTDYEHDHRANSALELAA
ncbi:IS3 family transposase [Streptomyces viridosporus]|uniref:IS3 family transposase n=1 Tax=Streptomyces viridosporus TaxID=67581 RepID=UPI00332025E0